jgi:hypothetical protein
MRLATSSRLSPGKSEILLWKNEFILFLHWSREHLCSLFSCASKTLLSLSSANQLSTSYKALLALYGFWVQREKNSSEEEVG